MPLYNGGETILTIAFDLRQPEQREALNDFRNAFGETADLESISEFVFALHIRPYLVRKAGESA